MKNTEPKSFTIGETVEWNKYIAECSPKDGWDLFYSFRNFESKFDIAAIAEVDHYLIKLTSDKTAAFKAGTYWWQATVAKGEDWRIVDEGSIEIRPNLALLDIYDGRRHV